MIRYVFVTATSVVILGLTLLVFMLPTESTSKSAAANSNQVTNSFLITNIKLFDGQQFFDNQNIRVEKGRISAIAETLSVRPDETVIDGKGLTALPGLLDAHTHSYGAALKDALRFGVTAHFDMFGAEDDLLDNHVAREQLNRTDKTDLFSSGTMATVERGHGTQYGFAIDTIDSIEQVAAWVKKRKKSGADYIKLVYMPYQDRLPSLDRQTAAEVIQQAHIHGLQVFAHISIQAAAKDMLEEGIDGLVHIFADSLVSDEVLQLAKQNDVFIIPTLAVIASVDNSGQSAELAQRTQIAEHLSAQQKSSINGTFGLDITGFDLAIAKQNVKRFFDAGVPILVGSDAPNPGTAYGVSTHHELLLMVESGLTPTQALIAATSGPAQQFKVTDRGRLQVGDRADMFLVKGDPSKNISDTLNVQTIFKNGYAIERGIIVESDNSKVGRTIASAVLGDFEDPDNLTSVDSFIWDNSDDQIANGQSVAAIQRISPGAHQSLGALQVTAEVNAGFPFAWAGAAIGDFSAPIDGLDISNYTHLVFDVKGTPGSYRVMSFSPQATGIPPTQYFKIEQQWQQVSLPLASFNGFNALQFSGFAIVAGPTHGKFEFTLDNVRFE